jgi:hypothetical protein
MDGFIDWMNRSEHGLPRPTRTSASCQIEHKMDNLSLRLLDQAKQQDGKEEVCHFSVMAGRERMLAKQ